MKAELVEQYIMVFNFGHRGPVQPSSHERIWLWVPLVPVSQNQGLPTLFAGSHPRVDRAPIPYNPVLRPGFALMFDGRLQTAAPFSGGGVVFARAYDVEKFQVT